MIEITNYETLLAVGRQQSEPQRFLFVFLQVSLPDNPNELNQQQFHSGCGGALKAIMCVDKALAELTKFSDLVVESEQMKQAWSMVIIACLSGKNGIPPSAETAKKPLQNMVESVQNGANLSRYLAFNRQGELLNFSS